VSKGSLIKGYWFQKYGEYLDIMPISCESFLKCTLQTIGRGTDGKAYIKKLSQIAAWSKQYNLLLKINTVR
jgi:radical S-adenosyl methionine domain-containing protein 2